MACCAGLAQVVLNEKKGQVCSKSVSLVFHETNLTLFERMARKQDEERRPARTKINPAIQLTSKLSFSSFIQEEDGQLYVAL